MEEILIFHFGAIIGGVLGSLFTGYFIWIGINNKENKDE